MNPKPLNSAPLNLNAMNPKPYDLSSGREMD